MLAAEHDGNIYVSESFFHYNKDWNLINLWVTLNGSILRVLLPLQQGLKQHKNAAYDGKIEPQSASSTTTRIETKRRTNYKVLSLLLRVLLPLQQGQSQCECEQELWDTTRVIVGAKNLSPLPSSRDAQQGRNFLPHRPRSPITLSFQGDDKKAATTRIETNSLESVTSR